jgi:hypothetical protein
MQDRLDLIAKRVDLSMIEPQLTKDGRQYMLRDLALEIVSGAPQHGKEKEDEEISKVFWWVKNNVEYRQDPADYDQYQTSGRTINGGGSDCDDHTILNASLLSSIGYRTGGKVVSPDGRGWHIYAIAGAYPFYEPTKIIALDTTQPEAYPGWQPPLAQRKQAYLVDFYKGRAANFRKVPN